MRARRRIFALYLIDEPQRALTLALDNWAVQREAIDARLVLEAAQAAGEPAAAELVRVWIEAPNGWTPMTRAVDRVVVVASRGAPRSRTSRRARS